VNLLEVIIMCAVCCVLRAACCVLCAVCCVLIFIFQLVFALIAALAIAVLLLKVQPFVDDSDDHVSTMAQVCIHVLLSGERVLSTLSLAEFFQSKLQPCTDSQPVVSTRSCEQTISVL
jgi:hypothetical protein